MDITSLQNQRVKEAVKLRDRRQRRKAGQFLIDGARELSRAIDAGIELAEIFICEPLCRSAQCQTVIDRLASVPAPQARVTPAVFEKMAFGERAEGVLAVAHTPHHSLDDLKLPDSRLPTPDSRHSLPDPRLPAPDSRPPLLVILEGVEKPGNVGAVLRSADAAGASAVLVAGSDVDLYNPNTVRASLGTIFTVPVCAAPADELLSWLTRRRLHVFAARVDAPRLYTDVDLRGPTALVLGSEAEGLSERWRTADVEPIRLPMHGAADSLNVSATAAVLLYEAVRQRAKL